MPQSNHTFSFRKNHPWQSHRYYAQRPTLGSGEVRRRVQTLTRVSGRTAGGGQQPVAMARKVNDRHSPNLYTRTRVPIRIHVVITDRFILDVVTVRGDGGSRVRGWREGKVSF